MAGVALEWLVTALHSMRAANGVVDISAATSTVDAVVAALQHARP